MSSLSQDFFDSKTLEIKEMEGDNKIRAAGSYVVQKHLEAWKELANGEPATKTEE